MPHQSDWFLGTFLPAANSAVTALSAMGGAGKPGTAITQTYSTAASVVPNATYAATALTPPAGGTGSAGGGYDTAGNRDLMITSVTALRTDLIALAADVLALKKVITQIVDDLQVAGIQT